MKIAALFLCLAFSVNAASIALIDHNHGFAATGSGTATTGTLNLTGANFIAACVVTFGVAATTATVSDSVNGSWSQHGTNVSSSTGTTANVALWYKANASVSSSMTVSASTTAGFAKLAAMGFSNVTTSSPVDQENTATWASGGTKQPGSITPGLANELLLSCMGILDSSGTGGIPSISGNSFILLDSDTPSFTNGQDVASAYVIQTTATAANPTWNQGSLNTIAGGGVTIESFTNSVGGGGSFVANPTIITVGP